jgi:hypothetical protein
MQDDNQALAADGDNQEQAGYESLLDDSGELEIPDPDALDESADDAPDEEADEAEAPESDEQDAKAVSDEAKVELDGRAVTVRELKETFATFRRKTQEYAEVDQQREHEARTAIAAVQENASQKIAAIAQRINDLVLPGVDLQTINRLSLGTQEERAQANELLVRMQIVEQWKQQIFGEAEGLRTQADRQREQAEQRNTTARVQLLQAEAEKLNNAKWFNDEFKIKAKSYLKSHGIPEQFSGNLPYAGAMEIINKAMRFDAAQKKIAQGKQPSQQAQVPTSAKTREGSSKQKADALFAAARKTPTRAAKAKAYTSLLGG